MDWRTVKITNPVFKNVKETALDPGLNAALENGYINSAGGISRFPQLEPFVDLPGDQYVIVEEWRGDLIGITGGKFYRVDDEGNQEDITGAFLSGPSRPVVTRTEDELVAAAGGPIVKLKGEMTDLLSEDAPEATHVAYSNGYLVANEPGSGRFNYTEPGDYDNWPALNILSAEAKPDNISAIITTEFDELIMAGPLSIEQFDQAPNGSRPFFKRWGLSAGLAEGAEHTIISVDNRIWGLNKEREWVAFSTQLGRIESGDIQNKLENLDDITDMWAAELPIAGHRFQVIQAPHATNSYGTKGVTLLYDYMVKRWYSLYGWDDKKSLPDRWPGWSHKQIGTNHYIGGNGKIYKLGGHGEGVETQRMIFRSGHYSNKGKRPLRINKTRIAARRGYAAAGSAAPVLSMRVNKDNRGFGRWMRKDLGKIGERDMVINFGGLGIADTFQFEIAITDAAELDINSFEILVDNLN